jgi:hypothetical protein
LVLLDRLSEKTAGAESSSRKMLWIMITSPFFHAHLRWRKHEFWRVCMMANFRIVYAVRLENSATIKFDLLINKEMLECEHFGKPGCVR